MSARGVDDSRALGGAARPRRAGPDARADDGLPSWAGPVLLGGAVAGWLVLPVIGVTLRPVFDWVLREDSVVEWGQFALILLSCVLALMAAVHLLRDGGQRAAAALLVLYAAGAVVLAGEEISWGQRVFALHTPEGLSEVNHQQELNIHNINVGLPVEALFDVMLVVLALTGTLLPLVVWRMRRTPGRTISQMISAVCPPLLAVPLFGQMLVYQALSSLLTVIRGREYDLVVRFQEWPEFCMYLAMALTMLVVYRRAARSSVGAGGAVRAPTIAAVAVALFTMVLVVSTLLHGVPPGNAGELTRHAPPSASPSS